MTSHRRKVVGRLESGRWLPTVGAWSHLLVIGACALGLGATAVGHWRRGLEVMGVGLILGSLLRLGVPRRAVGLLAVRGRILDAVLMGSVGVGIVLLTVLIPVPPAP